MLALEPFRPRASEQKDQRLAVRPWPGFVLFVREFMGNCHQGGARQASSSGIARKIRPGTDGCLQYPRIACNARACPPSVRPAAASSGPVRPDPDCTSPDRRDDHPDCRPIVREVRRQDHLGCLRPKQRHELHELTQRKFVQFVTSKQPRKKAHGEHGKNKGGHELAQISTKGNSWGFVHQRPEKTLK